MVSIQGRGDSWKSQPTYSSRFQQKANQERIQISDLNHERIQISDFGMLTGGDRIQICPSRNKNSNKAKQATTGQPETNQPLHGYFQFRCPAFAWKTHSLPQVNYALVRRIRHLANVTWNFLKIANVFNVKKMGQRKVASYHHPIQ